VVNGPNIFQMLFVRNLSGVEAKTLSLASLIILAEDFASPPVDSI